MDRAGNLQRFKVNDVFGSYSFHIIEMLKSPSFLMINESDEPSPNGVIGMPEFTAAEKGECYMDIAGSAVARFIHEFDGWQFQTRPPGAASKGDPEP